MLGTTRPPMHFAFQPRCPGIVHDPQSHRSVIAARGENLPPKLIADTMAFYQELARLIWTIHSNS